MEQCAPLGEHRVKGPKDLPGIPGDAPGEMTRAGLKREEGSIQEGLKSDGDSECDGTNPVHYYYPWFSPINLSSIGPDRARFDGGGRKRTVRPAVQ